MFFLTKKVQNFSNPCFLESVGLEESNKKDYKEKFSFFHFQKNIFFIWSTFFSNIFRFFFRNKYFWCFFLLKMSHFQKISKKLNIFSAIFFSKKKLWKNKKSSEPEKSYQTFLEPVELEKQGFRREEDRQDDDKRQWTWYGSIISHINFYKQTCNKLSGSGTSRAHRRLHLYISELARPAGFLSMLVRCSL